MQTRYNNKKFSISLNQIQFEQKNSAPNKFILKNTSLRTQSYEIINPNIQHYKITNRKFTLAPGMSQNCFITHTKCQKCHKQQFNKLRITNSDKQTILIDLICPQIKIQQVQLINYTKQYNFGQFTFDTPKQFILPIKNLYNDNLKLSFQCSTEQNHSNQQFFTLQFEQPEVILLKNRQSKIKCKLNFKKGKQFQIKLLINITSQQNLNQIKKTQTVTLRGNALVKSQSIKNINGKTIDSICLKMLNGTINSGQFYLDNNFRKNCYYKLIPQIHCKDPNQFSQKWLQSQIVFNEQSGEIKAYQNKKITYEIKTHHNQNDINFIQKFSKITYHDDFNFSKMKSSKYFRKNIDINVKVVFVEQENQKKQNISNFKIKLNVVNPALKINYKSLPNQEIFEIHNQSEVKIPFEIQHNSLYRANPTKGCFQNQKTLISFEWKGQRPQTAKFGQISKFSLAYGKCDLFLSLPNFNLQLYNFLQRQNIRPSTSTLKRNFGIDRNNYIKSLKRPFSALNNEMISKKMKLVRQQDFYCQIPRFLAFQKLRNQDLQKVIVSSSEKGNIMSNTWNKQICVYFPTRGHLLMKPSKAYLLPYQLNISTYQINQQQFHLRQQLSQSSQLMVNTNKSFYNQKDKSQSYQLSTKQINFCFNQNKKQYEVQNHLSITNTSKQTFKAFLLTIQDQYFVSGEEENKVIIHPNQTVKFRLKLFPNCGASFKQNKVMRKLTFLINGIQEEITCYGELLSVSCDITPKQLKFVESHFGQEQTSQMLLLNNTGLSKLTYQVICPQFVTVNYLQNSGTVAGKGKTTIEVKYKPNRFLQNFKDNIKILIRGSHVIYVPLLIDTKKPDIIIQQSTIDFGQGILGDISQAPITLYNKNKTNSECKIKLSQTKMTFQDSTDVKIISLKPHERRTVILRLKISEVGNIKKKIDNKIGQIQGLGPIQSPSFYSYVGKQNIMQITSPSFNNILVIQQTQSSHKIKFKNLIGQKLDIKCDLIPQKKYDDSFIMSLQRTNIELCAYNEKQILINTLISDLQKLTQQQRNYTLNVYRKGISKPYTNIKLNVKLPTPKLIIQPKQLYFPLIATNNWNHLIFKIVNKGYKQIHFKIKKPSNINFQLTINSKIISGIQPNQQNSNKLTKLNNQAEVRVSFKSKVPTSFQNVIQIQDNYSNNYSVKFYGLVTTCPLLLADTTGSMPISTKSIPSMVSMPLSKTYSTLSSVVSTKTEHQTEQHQIQHAKFFNYWIGTFMSQIKKQSSFHTFLTKPEFLIKFLQYFSIEIPKNQQKMSLSEVIFEMRKLDIPLDIINVQNLQKSDLSQWIKFVYIFISKKYIHPDCLKWLSKVSGQNVQNYQVAFTNYKKIISNALGNIFFKIFKGKLTQYQKIIQRLDPFLEFLYKIQTKKHLIISLNILYHKFSNHSSQTIHSEQLYHSVHLSHNQLYEKTLNWIISNGQIQYVSNIGATNIHTNMSQFGYYFTLDKSHLDSEVKFGLKDKQSIAILNSTLFEKCHFIQYDLEQIKPKVHNVTIQCEDKYSQQWILDYQAPLDSQYKIDFVGDSQFRCKFSTLGLVKMGKKIPISITYSPNNLNPHNGTLTILNKHFSQIYLIKGRALFSQNIEYEKQLKVYQGKKHFQTIQIPWQCIGGVNEDNNKKQRSQSKKTDKSESEVPNLILVQYNQKRPQFLSHNLTVIRQNKKQCLVKIKFQYLFQQSYKKLPLLYQITNEDQTQSKIIKIIIKVIPKPILIQAQVTCKLEAFVAQKIPLQNISNQKQIVHIQFFRNHQQQTQRYDQNSFDGSDSTDRNRSDVKSTSRKDNQFKLSKTGKMTLQPGHLQNISLYYRPDSLFQTFCHVRITYQESQSVIDYKFKGIPEFPSTYQQPIEINCLVEQFKIASIELKSFVRQNTYYEVETNIAQISGKDKVMVSSGQTVQYPFKLFCYHPGQIKGQIIFKSPEVTLIYPIIINCLQNSSLAKKYNLVSKVRQPMVLQLQLHNKSPSNITYSIICNNEYLVCPQNFTIQGNCKKTLQVTYLPLSVGLFNTQVKLYHPDLKQIIYQLELTAQQHEQIIDGPELQYFIPYTFILPIKNTTDKSCYIQRPNLPVQLSYKKEDIQFPYLLSAGKTVRLELYFKHNILSKQFDQKIIIKTDCIGQYKFNCKLKFLQTKSMENINLHYQSGKSQKNIQTPFKVNFLNGFNQKLKFNIQFKGTDNKILNSFNLITPAEIELNPYQNSSIQGFIRLNTPKTQKTLLSIESSQDLLNPINLTVFATKNKVRYNFVYPIKLIRIYENPQTIYVKSNAYEDKKTLINLAIVKDVARWAIQDLNEDFVKKHFGFKSINNHQNYLETIINKPFKYEGHIIFYNSKNQAEKIPLKVQIGQPKYESIVISSNVGQKSILQIQLKNGKGPFKVDLTNNKTQQFDVEPRQGVFVEQKGESMAKINFIYEPNEYSGLKRAKVAVISQQGCYYFNLIGKFKSLKNQRSIK